MRDEFSDPQQAQGAPTPESDPALAEAFAAATIAAASRAAPGADGPKSAVSAIEIRVLNGHQAGAKQAWDGQTLVVQTDTGVADPEHAATEEAADIVLFDAAKPPIRVRLLGPVQHAQVEIMAGSIKLDGASVGRGQRVPWQPYQALSIGSSLIAFGAADIADWSEQATDQSDRPEAALSDKVDPQAHQADWLQRIGIWPLAAVMVVVAVGATAMGVINPTTTDRSSIPVVQKQSFAAALSNSPFAQLRTKTLPDGKHELSGRLATFDQKRQLDAWLSQQDVQVREEVAVDEALVRDVAEVYRLNGLTVQASSRGSGSVLAVANEPDKQKFELASEAVRRDVRGLHELITRNAAKPAPPPIPKGPDDPNKRIVSLVPGAHGYLITADGARYFVGAMLPTGYRVAKIRSTSVLLERDGHQMRLRL